MCPYSRAIIKLNYRSTHLVVPARLPSAAPQMFAIVTGANLRKMTGHCRAGTPP